MSALREILSELLGLRLPDVGDGGAAEAESLARAVRGLLSRIETSCPAVSGPAVHS